MNPVLANPDIQCVNQGVKFGIEVKRCKSFPKFEYNITHAVGQIQRENLAGIVVADISVMLNRNNERITKPISDSELYKIGKFAMNRFVDDHYQQMLEWFKGSPARGLILIDHHIQFRPNSEWGLYMLTFGVNLSPDNQRQEFDSFMEQFSAGLPTPAVTT